mmetsp:Transcript_15603/g.36836  ORF Transcript_15603/g.36836 Transcript_15603/m.36836 type:complete len:171 (+) Transcript_15603:2577-3089(+)
MLEHIQTRNPPAIGALLMTRGPELVIGVIGVIEVVEVVEAVEATVTVIVTVIVTASATAPVIEIEVVVVGLIVIEVEVRKGTKIVLRIFVAICLIAVTVRGLPHETLHEATDAMMFAVHVTMIGVWLTVVMATVVMMIVAVTVLPPRRRTQVSSTRWGYSRRWTRQQQVV